MLVIKSSCSGQVLFAMELMNGELFVDPKTARQIIEAVGRCPIGSHTMVTTNGTSYPTPMSCMLGVSAMADPRVKELTTGSVSLNFTQSDAE